MEIMKWPEKNDKGNVDPRILIAAGNIMQACTLNHWPRGPMDKASAYGAGDCRFESCRGHFGLPMRCWARRCYYCAISQNCKMQCSSISGRRRSMDQIPDVTRVTKTFSDVEGDGNAAEHLRLSRSCDLQCAGLSNRAPSEPAFEMDCQQCCAWKTSAATKRPPWSSNPRPFHD